MKYLRRFNESIEDIDSICGKYGIRNYTINPDGSVDVDGDVLLSEKKLTRLPIKFGKVSGHFYCNNNKLTTLEGCPTRVGGGFYCYNNQLTTLKGGPTEVGGVFYCQYNQLTIVNWNDIYTINYDIEFGNNPIYEVYKIFPDLKTFKDSLEWNYFKEPNIIIRSIFVEACEVLSEETGKNIIVPEKINGYIFE